MPGDSIQPRVIDVISLPGVTVAQSARAPNVYRGLPALPETLVLETATELVRHLPPIYISAVLVEQSKPNARIINAFG